MCKSAHGLIGLTLQQVSQEEAIKLTHKVKEWVREEEEVPHKSWQTRRVRVTNLPRDDDLVDGLRCVCLARRLALLTWACPSTFLSALMKALQLTVNEVTLGVQLPQA